MRQVRQYASVMWDHHQQHLKSTSEMMKDNQPTTSFMTSAPPKMPLPWWLSSCWKTCSPGERQTRLQDVQNHDRSCRRRPAAGLLEPRNHSSRGHKHHFQVLQSRTDTYLQSYFPSAIRLWNSVSTDASSAVTLPVFRTVLTGWTEGRAYPRSESVIFVNLFLTPALTEQILTSFY